jgi:hypothetical protein
LRINGLLTGLGDAAPVFIYHGMAAAMIRHASAKFLARAASALQAGGPDHLRRRRALQFLALQMRSASVEPPPADVSHAAAPGGAAGRGEKARAC